MLLTQRQVIERVGGLPNSTVRDWISEYHMFIPTKQDGRKKYYLEEAVTVLKEIKRLRNENMVKPNIIQYLTEKGYPITVEEIKEEIKEKANEEVAVGSEGDKVSKTFQMMLKLVKEMESQDIMMSEIRTKVENNVKREEWEELMRENGLLVARLSELESKINNKWYKRWFKKRV